MYIIIIVRILQHTHQVNHGHQLMVVYNKQVLVGHSTERQLEVQEVQYLVLRLVQSVCQSFNCLVNCTGGTTGCTSWPNTAATYTTLSSCTANCSIDWYCTEAYIADTCDSKIDTTLWVGLDNYWPAGANPNTTPNGQCTELLHYFSKDILLYLVVAVKILQELNTT